MRCEYQDIPDPVDPSRTIRARVQVQSDDWVDIRAQWDAEAEAPDADGPECGA